MAQRRAWAGVREQRRLAAARPQVPSCPNGGRLAKGWQVVCALLRRPGIKWQCKYCVAVACRATCLAKQWGTQPRCNKEESMSGSLV
jgi:hypothetical protein